jgi:hypothetical protein
VSAPDGVIVKTLPEQTVPLFTVMAGVWNTVTVDTAVWLTQPAVLVPVTEYDCVRDGLTVGVTLLNV